MITRPAPERKIGRWWTTVCGNVVYLVYLLDNGRLQECFDDKTSKGPEHIFDAADYSCPGVLGKFTSVRRTGKPIERGYR